MHVLGGIEVGLRERKGQLGADLEGIESEAGKQRSLRGLGLPLGGKNESFHAVSPRLVGSPEKMSRWEVKLRQEGLLADGLRRDGHSLRGVRCRFDCYHLLKGFNRCYT